MSRWPTMWASRTCGIVRLNILTGTPSSSRKIRHTRSSFKSRSVRPRPRRQSMATARVDGSPCPWNARDIRTCASYQHLTTRSKALSSWSGSRRILYNRSTLFRIFASECCPGICEGRKPCFQSTSFIPYSRAEQADALIERLATRYAF